MKISVGSEEMDWSGKTYMKKKKKKFSAHERYILSELVQQDEYEKHCCDLIDLLLTN